MAALLIGLGTGGFQHARTLVQFGFQKFYERSGSTADGFEAKRIDSLLRVWQLQENSLLATRSVSNTPMHLSPENHCRKPTPAKRLASKIVTYEVHVILLSKHNEYCLIMSFPSELACRIARLYCQDEAQKAL